MRAVYLLPLLLVGACGGASQEPGDDEPAGDTTAIESERDPESGVTAVNARGVWVFTYEAGDISLDAVHSGPTGIVADCLVVRDAVVVWPTSRLDEALAYVAEVERGTQRGIDLGGAGLSVLDGGRLPPFVTDKCEADTVWYASPAR